MEQAQRQELKTAIEQAIVETRARIASLEELTRPVSPENAIGRISRMEAIGEKSINEAALAEARQQLQALEQAQSQVDREDFGECEECGEPIAIGRLLLMPGATRCVRCAD